MTEYEIDEFDRLYNGDLSEEHYYLLKAKLKLDEVLHYKYIVYKLLRKEIEQDGEANKILKERFAAIELSLKKKKFRLFYILASALILIALFFIFKYKNKNIELYEKYRDSESGITIKMSTQPRNKLDTTMLKIAKGDYKQALSMLGQLKATDTTLYYKAYCNERLGNYNEASIDYTKLFNSKSSVISQKSTFRSALLKLRSGDKNSVSELKSIALDSENLYNRTAQEIIASMNK